MKQIKIILFLCLMFCCIQWSNAVSFSTAGFYELPDAGRKAYSMNLVWRFVKGDVAGTPYALDFDDSDWEAVSVPTDWNIYPLKPVVVPIIRG